jgi:FlaG/FlaF family flagellin (archaellin)
MRKQFNRNNHALSTVISTILMIMVVMIGMTLLFAYVTVYADNYKAGAGGAVMESLTIEDVWFRNSTAIQISIYNTGKVDCKINSIYDNGIALGTNLNTQVKLGEHKVIVINQPTGQWLPSNVLKIVTSRSSEFTGTYSYPTEVR